MVGSFFRFFPGVILDGGHVKLVNTSIGTTKYKKIDFPIKFISLQNMLNSLNNPITTSLLSFLKSAIVLKSGANLLKILTCTVVLIAIVLSHKTPDNVAFWDFEKPNPTASPLFQGDFLVGS